MTVRHLILAAVALCALLLGVGCKGGGDAPQIAEIDEPLYVQGVQLKKQGRNPEALSSFLKVIERRGPRESPESHVEAGSIYLNHTKDPILAYYHFSKYLELQPNSKQAPFVRGMVQAATREFAARIPGRPLDNQSVRLAADEELTKLRRENEELRAELATLRGGGAVPINRMPRMLSVNPLQEAPRGNDTRIPLETAPPPPPPSSRPIVMTAERPTIQPAPTIRPPAALATPTRPGRTHLVREKESLWKIARDHYGAGVTGAQVRGIFEANRGTMRDEGDLRPGMTLRIP
jgi:hypothetical protein